MDAVFLTISDGRIVAANPAACAMFGMTEDELCAAGRAGICDPADPRWSAFLEERKRVGKARGELRHKRKDGSTFVGDVSSVILEDGQSSFVIVRDITEEKAAEEALRESEARVRHKLNTVLAPDGDIGVLKLADILDPAEIHSLMEEFSQLTHIPVAIIDLEGEVLVGVGWQDICTKFHRINPETCHNCIESDVQLSSGVAEGEYKLYKCRNNMWDVATPLMVAGRHVGNIFMGQFFFEDERVDQEVFRSQARRYGFNEEEYLAALETVPRFNRDALVHGMKFFQKLAVLISRLTYSNLQLARTIAERERAERQIRLQASMLDAVGQGVIATDLQKKIIYWNNAATALFGWHREEVIGKNIMDIAVPQMAQQQADEIMHALFRGEAWTGEFPVRRKDGKVLDVIVTDAPVFEEGHLIGVIGVFSNITERKRTEEALRESTAQLRVVVENIEEGLIVSTMDEELIHWNRAALEMHGFASVEECRGRLKDFTSIFQLSTLDGIEVPVDEWPLSRILRGEQIRDYELRIRRLSTGWQRIYNYGGSIVRDVGGEPLLAILTINDFTERRAREQALRESEARYRALVEQAAVGIAQSDLNGKLIFVNERYCEILGRRREELLGMRLQDITDELDRPRDLSSFAQLIKQGTGYSIEKRYLRPDGSAVCVEDEVRLVYGANGEPLYAQVITQDITERKEIDRLKDEFISTAAHELRTPLTMVMGYAELLQEEERFPPEERKEFLRLVNEKSEVLDRIIRDLLDLSRVQAGKLVTIEKVCEDFVSLVRNAVGAYRGITDRHMFQIDFQDAPIEICFDPGKIGQVFDNLLSNAMKFSPDGGTVRVIGRRVGEAFEVTVADEGIGMRPEAVARIFDKFYRVDASNTAVGGLGLGMSIVKNIVEAHGGHIWVESELGRGTRVHFSLPV
jgi:PAS domain S-box-containing protein